MTDLKMIIEHVTRRGNKLIQVTQKDLWDVTSDFWLTQKKILVFKQKCLWVCHFSVVKVNFPKNTNIWAKLYVCAEVGNTLALLFNSFFLWFSKWLTVNSIQLFTMRFSIQRMEWTIIWLKIGSAPESGLIPDWIQSRNRINQHRGKTSEICYTWNLAH